MRAKKIGEMRSLLMFSITLDKLLDGIIDDAWLDKVHWVYEQTSERYQDYYRDYLSATEQD